MKLSRLVLACVFVFSLVAVRAADFTLVADRLAAPFLIEPATDPAVARAADDVRHDIEQITGTLPALHTSLAATPPRTVILAGILGHDPLLDRLAASEKRHLLNATFQKLHGAWESFVIAVVDDPFPGVDQALVVAGSDRRGAIYGLYEISRELGVSPWHWWADVPPPKKPTLTLPAGRHRFGPPSVKYRGLFINDEDWGLQPWAAKTFEPEFGNIGPKTYARVFELLLRLRANTLWPAMHACTKPFFATPENARLAEAYGIVLGSSHAEPMLRNNVGEWPHDRAADYNYLTHRDEVLRYWDERVADAAQHHVEAIYTLGMRGIHDSAMQGPTTDAERIATLEKIFADQRALLAKHLVPVGRVIPDAPSMPSVSQLSTLNSQLSQIPQIFCAYKEVLDLYRGGLRVPDDVTIVYPDDNFGYVRDFASPAERTRSGGFGVYYHLSYLGRPLSYLWLCTTPPALIWEEMHKAYEHGADRLWIANVGDLKPAEIPLTFFLELGWDIDRYTPDTLPDFLRDFAARTFGPEHAADLASLLSEYYVLNFQRKPEHLQWWLPREPHRPSPLTDAEVGARLAAFASLRTRADALRAQISAPLADAFYELVYYPVVGSALANERYFLGERGTPESLAAALAADARLTAETKFFNDDLAGGKWRGLLSLEPADDQWSSMRLARWTPPATPRAPVPSPARDTFLAVDAADFSANPPASGARWQIIPGLGRTGRAVTVLPAMNRSVALTDAARLAPRLDFPFTFPRAGEFTLRAYLLPTHPLAGTALRFAVALDDAPPRLVSLEVGDGGPNWARGVLDATRLATAPLSVSTSGPHVLRIFALDPGVVLDRLVIDLGGLTPSYLGPSR